MPRHRGERSTLSTVGMKDNNWARLLAYVTGLVKQEIAIAE
ncbi:MAG: hypothetical protein ACRD7E_31635 [Bryobacteraceae bacterium]